MRVPKGNQCAKKRAYFAKCTYVAGSQPDPWHWCCIFNVNLMQIIRQAKLKSAKDVQTAISIVQGNQLFM